MLYVIVTARLGKGGLEPPTLRLSGVYSYQLSYLPLRSFAAK